ncbi:MAG: bifunctional DNA-formamidopyrimidine glycosylase/DNA-(apurinic or apyrimidinic site) lyase [Candidatus Saccharibacteria bacterium]|nr:bifunctional DNA-formamidopyrimidine glycosylase/DNA-(apurinic or apyrimidinic site) lyase [Candidatus Saccharibacteria bacterium]
MPELPEVETVRRGLAELLPGRRVARVVVFDSPKSFPNAKDQVEQFLYGANVTAVRRRAKVLLIELDSGYTLLTHLKMTGQLVFRSSSAQRAARGGTGPASLESDFAGGHPNDSLIGELPDRSTRVQLEFADGSRLFFNDQRKFGWLQLLPTAEVSNTPFMQKVGPEPLDPRTTSEQFIQRIRRRNGSLIKPAFLDQSVIAGVGNIYADEALWAARIHPEARVREVTDEQLNTLFTELKKVLQLSIDQGGSTDKNYVDAEGRRGNYLQFAHVFRRQGQPCHRHPDQEIIKTKVGGRGTHTCPVCQVKEVA